MLHKFYARILRVYFILAILSRSVISELICFIFEGIVAYDWIVCCACFIVDGCVCVGAARIQEWHVCVCQNVETVLSRE